MQDRIFRYVLLLLGALAFGFVMPSSVEAQLFQRHRAGFWRGPEVVRPAGDYRFSRAKTSFVDVQPVASRLPKWPSYEGYDPRIHPDADAWSRYPKYLGGFHSSHFTNVGLPSGDIGFRGNGLYWTPW
jgi:hypothetical protein